MIEQDLSQFSMLDLFRVEAETQALVLTSGLLALEEWVMTAGDSTPPRLSAIIKMCKPARTGAHFLEPPSPRTRRSR